MSRLPLLIGAVAAACAHSKPSRSFATLECATARFTGPFELSLGPQYARGRDAPNASPRGGTFMLDNVILDW